MRQLLNSNWTFCLVFFMFLSNIYSQNDSVQINKRFKGGMKIGLYQPILFGDNYLGSGHNANYLGLEIVLAVPVRLHGFGFGAGIQFSSFEAVDPRFVGDISRSNIVFYNLQGFYQHALSKKWHLEHALGIGIQDIQGSGISITSQVGTAVILGSVVKFAVADHFGFYGGLNYVGGFHEIQAPSEVKKYFERNHQIQIVFGITFYF